MADKISSVIAHCISPYAGFYAGLSCFFKPAEVHLTATSARSVILRGPRVVFQHRYPKSNSKMYVCWRRAKAEANRSWWKQIDSNVVSWSGDTTILPRKSLETTSANNSVVNPCFGRGRSRTSTWPKPNWRPAAPVYNVFAGSVLGLGQT